MSSTVLFSERRNVSRKHTFLNLIGNGLSNVMTMVNNEVGIGTTVPRSALYIEGDVILKGQFMDSNLNPMAGVLPAWLPMTVAPSFTLPGTGGAVTYSKQQGSFRFSGNEILYNVNIECTVTSQPTGGEAAGDYKLTLPDSIAATSYAAATIVGDLWLSVTVAGTTNTFKALAKTSTSDATTLTVRYLSGTTEGSLAYMTAGATIQVQGTMIYTSAREYLMAPPSTANRSYQVLQNQALSLLGSTFTWRETQVVPTFAVETPGAISYPGTRKGLFKYLGTDVAFNVNVKARIETAPPLTSDYKLALPYPVKLASYAAPTVIGDLWLNVYNGLSSNAFKAYAETMPSDSNSVLIRYVSGTTEDSLATMTAGITFELAGTMTYDTTVMYNGDIYTAYIPPVFSQDTGGNVVMNGSGYLPRGRLDVIESEPASTSPVMVVDQKGAGDVVQFKKNGVTQVRVDNDGDLYLPYGGSIYNSSNEAVWIPGSTLQWFTTAAPTLVLPAGATNTITSGGASYRYIGTEVAYNFRSTRGVSLAAASSTSEYRLTLPYALDMAVYPSPSVVGDLWLTVTNSTATATTTFKAYARTPTLAADSNMVSLRYLNGTTDSSLSEFVTGTSFTVQGVITYSTPLVANLVNLPRSRLPTVMTEDQEGRVALSTGQAPQARLQVLEPAGGLVAGVPALMVDQQGTGDIARFKDAGVDKVVIDGNGNVGVQGNVVSTGTVSAGNGLMFRNRIINGDMRIDQRNAGKAGLDGFGPDRFKVIGTQNAVCVLPKQVVLPAADIAATGGFNYATSLTTIAGPTAGLTTWLRFNGDVTDFAGGLTSPTVTGTMQYVTGVVSSAGTGSALYLANEGNLLATPTRATNTLSFTTNVSGAFSVSLWFQLTKLPLSGAIQIFSFGTTATTYYEITITYVNSTYGNLNAWSGNNTTNAPVSINVWYHVAAVWIPSSTVQLYLNGAPVGGTAVVTSTTYSNITLCIGEEIRTINNRPFAGYIDDFRIYNRALGSGEIALLAGCTTGITSAPTSGLVAYYPFENSTAESSGNSGPALTTTGSVSYVTGVVGTKAVYLANEGNVLATPTKASNQISAPFTSSTNPITTSFWLRLTKLPLSGQSSTVIAYGPSNGAYYQIYAYYLSANIANLCGWSTNESTAFPVTTGTWYHVTIVWIQSSTLSFYINGNHISSTTSSASASSGTLFFGDDPRSNVFRPFAGYIDDFRIYNRALTPPEIAYLAGNAIYPSIQTFNQAAYFPFDGALTDASGNGVTLTPTGTMQYVSGVTGTQALYLANEANVTASSAAQNYIRNTTLSFSALGSFSVSMWIYPTIFKAYSMVFFSTNSGTTAVTNSVGFYISNSFKLTSDFYGTSAAVGTTTISANVWYYVTLTYNSGTTTIYLNGTREGTTTGTIASSTGFSIGTSFTTYSGPFAGYIDDFRIFNTALTQSQVTALYYGSANIASRSTPLLNYTPSAAVLYQQSIEGTNIADLAFGTSIASSVSASCWIKNNTAAAQTFTMSLNNGLASGPRSILYTTPSIPAGTWSRIAFTVPGDVLGTWAINNGLGLNLAIALGANNTNAVSMAGSWLTDAYYTESGVQFYGSATGVLYLQDNAIFVTGVQLERGALTTPFEFRPQGVEYGLVTAGVDRVSILDNGNVGIGTTNPLAKLHVNGLVLKQNIAFSVYKTNGNVGPVAYVTYNQINTNVGDAYSAATGYFTAPIKGVYFFSFFGMTYTQVNVFYELRKNNIDVGCRPYSTANTHIHAHLHASCILQLNQGDYVGVVVMSGNMYGEGAGHNQFSGYLIG